MAKLTARIVANESILLQRDGEDFHELTAFILFNLEEEFPHACGEIIDNMTQKVIQQYRRTPIC